MSRYVACLDLSNASLGDGAAAALTTGTKNVCVGPGAGRALTTGAGNVILGAAPGAPADAETVVLSTGGTGAVRARWTADGDTQLALRATPADPPPGFATFGYDAATHQLAVRYHDGVAVRANTLRSDARVSELAPLTEATTAAGTVGLVADPAARALKRLVAGANVTLTESATAVTVAGPAPGATTLDALTDAASDAAGLALGVGAATAAGATGNVAVGPAALAAGGAQSQNTAVGANAARGVGGPRHVAVGADAGGGLAGAATPGVGQANVSVGRLAGGRLTDGNANVFVGRGAGAAATTAQSNVAVGAFSLAAVAATPAGDGNVAVGYNAARFATGADNVCVGRNAGGALTTGGNNLYLGTGAGAGGTTGSGNVVLGGGALGDATASNTVVIADGAGNVVVRWDGTAGPAVQRLDGSGGTLRFDPATALGGLTATAVVGGATTVVELTNERPVNPTDLTASATLTAAHRNRFTVCTAAAAAVVTVVAYAGIVTGAEHEFFHNGASTLTFTGGSGAAILSAGGLLGCVTRSAVLLKYLGNNTFALVGALQ